ncbi:MAG: hypothetical protein HC906_03935 [Bacteroidales bacterium]|nr:hypothetical protein [Bacteroidales bacterium]
MKNYGLIYKETIPDGFPVDPWTTYSHILLVVLLIFWFIRIIPRWKHHKFLTFSLFLISLNLIGSLCTIPCADM